jgi:SAM-dependent methyltransferase
MEFHKQDVSKFVRGVRLEDVRFWARMGHKPDLRGATVLEIGCGWGSLSLGMALDGAQKVVGLDLNSERVNFANEYVRTNYPRLVGAVEFRRLHLQNYEHVLFDYIVSKDTFEHIVDLDCMLSEMIRRLKPGGKIYTGFGPLYTSPYGDHSRRRVILKPWGVWGRILALAPWGHLFMEPLLIKLNNRYREKKITSMKDLDLSTLSLSDYRKVFARSGLITVSFRVNQSERWLSKPFSMLSRIPPLADYFTHSVYCVLQKPGDALSRAEPALAGRGITA